MKPLTLSTDHREKLLEMCKKLFPEYTNWKFGRAVNNGQNELWFQKNEETYRTCYEIHWFEFCMTHLLTTLADRKADIDLMEILIEGYHPVDYLYEQFKKKLSDGRR